jgi:hypothetical protein
VRTYVSADGAERAIAAEAMAHAMFDRLPTVPGLGAAFVRTFEPWVNMTYRAMKIMLNPLRDWTPDEEMNAVLERAVAALLPE